MLGPELVDDMEEGKELKKSKLLTQFQNGLQVFPVQSRNFFSEIRALELRDEKLTVSQLKQGDGELVQTPRGATDQFHQRDTF